MVCDEGSNSDALLSSRDTKIGIAMLAREMLTCVGAVSSNRKGRCRCAPDFFSRKGSLFKVSRTCIATSVGMDVGIAFAPKEKAPEIRGLVMCVAERGGFEPPKRGLDAYTLSRRAPSTTRTPLRTCCEPAAGAQILAGERAMHKHLHAGAGGMDRRGTMDVPMKTVA